MVISLINVLQVYGIILMVQTMSYKKSIPTNDIFKQVVKSGEKHFFGSTLGVVQKH